jgi:autotransporter passenger strand-loop-strand repeat protein
VIASGTKIGSGGREIADKGAIASATVVLSGGQLIVNAGGTAKKVSLLGGTEIVSKGAAMGQAVTFGQHGTLSVAGTVLAPYIAGFGATDRIILTAFAFGGALKHSFAENANGKNGVLKITDGGETASITLFGQYVAAGFHFAKSGTGTVITYSAPASGHMTALAVAHG